MLCYRCGSHVPDASESCPSCGQQLLATTAAGKGGASAVRRKPPGTVEAAPFRAGDLIGTRYEVVDIAGSGPVGFVFKARDKELDLTVAVKVINSRLVQDDEERAQLSRVVKQARKLSHANLARVNDEGEANGAPFYVTPFFEGMSLRKIMDARAAKAQAFTLAELEPIVGQIAAALTSAHKHGPHTDLKPENVLIQPDLLKVTDFGLGSAFPRAPFVQAQKVRRADKYLAPEFVGGANPDVRIDVFALGVILGEMLTGLGPGEGAQEAIKKRTDLPPTIAALYGRATNPSPTARFSTPAELFTELQQIARKHVPARVADARADRTEPNAHRAPVREPPPPPVPTSALPAGASGAELRRAEKPRVPEGKRDTGEPKAVTLPVPAPIPAAVEPKQAVGRKDTPPPPDATQPLDLSKLPFLLGQTTASDAPKPFDPSLVPPGTPADATQPIDAELLAKLIGPAPVAPTRTIRAQEAPPPPSKKAPSGVQQFSPEATQPVPATRLSMTAAPPVHAPPPVPEATQPIGDLIKKLPPRRTEETMPLDVSQMPLARNQPATDPSPSRPMGGPGAFPSMSGPFSSARAHSSLRSNATLLLVALTVCGLLLGVAGGSWLLDRLRHHSVSSDVVSQPGAAASLRCPTGMELIGSGAFNMGTAKGDPMMGFDERPLAPVEVPAFCIDRYEFPNAVGEKPRVNVSWTEAESACQAQGKRLCSEQEWEKACKGPQSLRFPYGNTFDANACNTEDAQGEDRDISGAGAFERCRSAFGVMDLSGNVAEWTSTAYGNSADKAQKGGSSDRPDYAARCSARRNGAPTARSSVVGFRCCEDVP